MSVLGDRRRAFCRASRWGRLVAVLLATAFAAGCDDTLDPFAENPLGPYSIFGYLDVTADTQWVRVMPVRQTLLADPAPIDATVTLENVGTGEVVTMHDSVFAFTDRRLDTTAYAHNFWTTEPIESEETYRLTATRSDGATTTALVETPPRPPVSLLYLERLDRPGVFEPRRLELHWHLPLYKVVWYTVWDRELERPGDPVGVWDQPFTVVADGVLGYRLPGTSPTDALPSGQRDMFRRRAEVVVAQRDWPYDGSLSPTEFAIPGAAPTTVENGVGALVGVATLGIPLALCRPIEARPGEGRDCTITVDPGSATVEGTTTRDPCSEPYLPPVRLTERFADGGAVVWEWKTGWSGDYRFVGVEPGSELLLEFPDRPGAPISIPPLGPGERHVVPPVHLLDAC